MGETERNETIKSSRGFRVDQYVKISEAARGKFDTIFDRAIGKLTKVAWIDPIKTYRIQIRDGEQNLMIDDQYLENAE